MYFKKIIRLFLFISCLESFAQEEPYFEPFEKRGIGDIAELPNLKTLQNRVYVGGNGGLRLSKTNLANLSPYYEINGGGQLFWEFFGGYNRRDDWYFEIGYAQNPLYLNTVLKEGNSGFRSIYVSLGDDFKDYQFRVKKRIIYIDKVVRRAGIFGIGGLSYSPQLANGYQKNYTFDIPTYGRQGVLIENVNHLVTQNSSGQGISLEIGVEVSGRVIDAVEIGLFCKTYLRPTAPLENELSYQFDNNDEILNNQKLFAANFNLGLMLKWNIVNWVKYKNDIE